VAVYGVAVSFNMPCWLSWIILVHYIAHMAANILSKHYNITSAQAITHIITLTQIHSHLSLKQLSYHNYCVNMLITWEHSKLHYYS